MDATDYENASDTNMDGGQVSASSGKTTKPPLRRGDACLYCRKRKLRCDAAKPSCNQCTRAKKTDPCEYDQGKPKSRVKILEAKIAVLENQISNPNTSGYSIQEPSRYQQSSEAAFSNLLPEGFDNMTVYPSRGSGPFNTAYAHPPFNLGTSFQQGVQGYRQDVSAPPPNPVHRNSDESTSVRNTGINLTVPTGNGLDNGMNTAYQGYFPNQGSESSAPPSWMPYQTTSANSMAESMNNVASSEPGRPFIPSVLVGQGDNALGTDFIDEYRKTMTPAHPLYVAGLTDSDYAQAKSLLESGDGQMQSAMTPQTQSLMDSLFSTMRPATPSEGMNGGEISSNMESGRREAQGYSRDGTATTSVTSSFDFSTLDPTMRTVTSGIDMFDFSTPPGGSGATPLRERFQPSLPTDVTLPDNSYAMYLPSGRTPNIGEPSAASEFNLTTGWYDPLDLPQPARDELLRIFFETAAIYMLGMNMARFKARLTLPANKRPHPCWLYGMYLFASRYSADPALRSLEGHFYEIANTQFEIAVQNADRLLDAIRGAHLVSVYCYSRGKYLQAWVCTGKVVRLSMAAGLHSIESNNFMPFDRKKGPSVDFDRPTGDPNAMNNDWAIPAAQDPVDLAERISTFWMVWYLDRAGSIAMRWPAGFETQDCLTPFPAETPETATIGREPLYDERLRDLLKGENRGVQPDIPMWAMLCRAMGLLHEVAQAVRRPRTRVDGTFNTPGGTTMPPAMEPRLRYQNPAEFQRLDKAISAFVDSFLPYMRDPIKRIDGRKDVDIHIVSLHSFVACSQMWLHDSEDWRYDNAEALEAARRVLTLGRIIPEAKLSKLDLYLPMFWAWSGKVLIRELKRLDSLGDNLATVALEAELDMMVERLKALGKSFGLADLQAERVQNWREATDTEEEDD